MAEVHLLITRLRVSLVPPDDREADLWQVTVEWTGGDRYAVRWLSSCLNADTGEWDDEPNPSSRDDAFLAAHRFDYLTAQQRAGEACQHIAVNGLTVTDYLTRRAAGDPETEGADRG